MKPGPRVICVGANLESLEALNGLNEVGANIVGIVTALPQKEVKGSDYRDLSAFACESDIDIHKTEDVNSQACINFLKGLEADYLFILGWSQIVSHEVIALFELCLGSHPSKLPYGAGRAPVPWTIIEDLDETAISVFELTAEVDAGRLVYQHCFKVPQPKTATALYCEVAKQLTVAFQTVYQQLALNTLEFIEQDLSARSVRGKRTPVDGLIDFNHSAESVVKLVNSVTEPYPGAYTYLNNQKIIVWAAELAPDAYHSGTLGQVLQKKAGQVLVQCGDKPVYLSRLCADSGDELDISILPLGTKLGFDWHKLVESQQQQIEYLMAEVNKLKEEVEAHGAIKK